MKRPLLVFLALAIAVLTIVHPHAATVWAVKSDGTGDFLSISACQTGASAGDTCKVFDKGSTYTAISITKSGTVGNPITYIANTGDTVSVSGTWTVTNTHDITISGFRMTGTNPVAGSDGASITTARIIFSSNTMPACGGTPSGFHTCIVLYGTANVIDGNSITNVGDFDYIDAGGTNVVIRNNTCQGASGTGNAEHIDCMPQDVGGTSPHLADALIEGNHELSCSGNSGNCHGIQVRAFTSDAGPSDHVIVRYNSYASMDGACVAVGNHSDGTAETPNWHVYNNTCATGSLVALGDDTINGDDGNIWVFNNIIYNSAANGTKPVSATSGYTYTGNGNLVFNTGYSGSWTAPITGEATYAALHNQDPQFNNPTTDLTLKATSPAINAGSTLTTASGAGVSSTSLTVGDARFFQPGWAGMPGDWLRIGTSTKVQITGANYSTNVLTLATPVSWNNGDAVNLWKRTDGTVVLSDSNTVPDVGAFPFSSGTPPVLQRIRFIRVGDLLTALGLGALR